MPTKQRTRKALIAAMLSFSLGFTFVGYAWGTHNTQVTSADLVKGRKQSYARTQCLADITLVPGVNPADRLKSLGGDSHLQVICPRVAKRLRPNDPAPDVGSP